MSDKDETLDLAGEEQEAADRAERERLAKIAEEERKAREAAEAEARRLQAIADQKAKEEADAKAAEAERARLAALAPDKEKLKSWVNEIEGIVRAFPNISAPELVSKGSRAQNRFIEAVNELREAIK